MHWSNYGTLWVIDHIFPCASWDLSKVTDSFCCWHYKNLQPLWKFENESKRAAFDTLKKAEYVRQMLLF